MQKSLNKLFMKIFLRNMIPRICYLTIDLEHMCRFSQSNFHSTVSEFDSKNNYGSRYTVGFLKVTDPDGSYGTLCSVYIVVIDKGYIKRNIQGLF
jgi:hypothetical protein